MLLKKALMALQSHSGASRLRSRPDPAALSSTLRELALRAHRLVRAVDVLRSR